MSEKVLVPIEQKTVLFYEDEITAVLINQNNQQQVYVPVRPLSDALGLAWSGQFERLQRDQVLSEVSISVRVTRTQDQAREMICLPLSYINGWLFGINAKRVKVEVRERLLRYQRECYAVLHEAFQDGRLTTDPTLDDLLSTDSDAAQAYKMLQGMLKLARHQLILESRLDLHDKAFEDVTERLEGLEAAIAQPDSMITQDHASQISQAVKTVAILQGKQTKRNEFGAVYGELYRKFGITSYKMLPAARFEEAMSFFNEWRESLGSDSF